MDKKEFLRQTFDCVAQGYDHPALSFFPQTAERIIEVLNLQPDNQILDVCCGTGVVAITAAPHVPKGHVTGIDLSQGMLDQAIQKSKNQRLGNIDFLKMDLDDLTFSDQHFDHAACSFGVFFLDNMEDAMRNIFRVVKKGGQIAISSFAEGCFEPMSDLLANRIKSYGYEVPPLSWKQITTDEQLTRLYEQAGLTRIQIYREDLGFHMKSAQDWWDIVWNAGYRGLLNQLTPDELEQFKSEHLQEVQDLCDKGQNLINIGVVITLGKVA